MALKCELTYIFQRTYNDIFKLRVFGDVLKSLIKSRSKFFGYKATNCSLAKAQNSQLLELMTTWRKRVSGNHRPRKIQISMSMPQPWDMGWHGRTLYVSRAIAA